MEETLQYETTTQCLGLPPTGPGNHRPDGTQANNALTFKLDHLGGADHGERGDISSLDRSIALQRKMRTTIISRPIELSTNFANALIRRFEAVGDTQNLNEAREVLEALDEPENDVVLSEFQAYPKSQNALGNVFKQKMLRSGGAECYAKALEAYTKAEKYWTEKTAPYEWAMIQKNKAETTLFFAENADISTELIDTAIAQAETSLKYRTESQSPYQFERSIKTLEALVLMKAERYPA